VALFCGVTWWWGRGRPERVWTIFVAGAGVFLSLYVLGLYYFRFRVIGEPARLLPELDLALILVFVEIVRALWKNQRLRLLAVFLVILGFCPAIRYVRHAWSPFPKAGPLEKQYDYAILKWVHEHLPDQRIFATGTVRFWFNAWFDNPQVDGGSAQGMLNQMLPMANWQITAGDKGQPAILWLQALGADAIVVADRTSLDWYHDYQRPEKFRGLTPVLYDDGHGTVIYRIPRLYPGIGRVVDTAKIAEMGTVRGGDDVNTLARYVAVVDSPDQSPVQVNWIGSDQLEVQAQVSQGKSLLLQETYDPGWHVYEEGRALSVRAEAATNFMLIDVPEGNHKIQVRFETPLENRIGRGISILGLILVAGLFAQAATLAYQRKLLTTK